MSRRPWRLDSGVPPDHVQGRGPRRFRHLLGIEQGGTGGSGAGDTLLLKASPWWRLPALRQGVVPPVRVWMLTPLFFTEFVWQTVQLLKDPIGPANP